MATNDRAISEVLQDIVRNIQLIIRSELLLAKAEVREEVGKAKSVGTLVGAGLVCGIFGAFFLLLTAVYALARVVPDWAAALIIAVVVCVAAAMLLFSGLAQWRRVNVTPKKAIESVKENVEWAKQQGCAT